MDQIFFMRRLVTVILLGISASSALQAQSVNRASTSDPPAMLSFAADGSPALSSPPIPAPAFVADNPLPRMSSELALSTYQQRANRQAQTLAGYSAAMLVRADLPDNAQHGEYELERHYTAPHTLTFKSLRFE